MAPVSHSVSQHAAHTHPRTCTPLDCAATPAYVQVLCERQQVWRDRVHGAVRTDQGATARVRCPAVGNRWLLLPRPGPRNLRHRAAGAARNLRLCLGDCSARPGAPGTPALDPGRLDPNVRDE
jgi:hypothetical protein